MTRDEYLKTTTRVYNHVDKDKLIASIEGVFTLSDPNDIQVVHSPNGIRITRPWFIYMVLAAAQGTDNWIFDLTEDGDGYKVTAFVGTAQSNINGYVAGADSGTVTTVNAGTPVAGNAVYEVFWARLDYLLGRTEIWADCKTAEANKDLHGALDALCGVTNKNSYPSNLSDAEIERIFKNSYTGKWAYMKIHHREKWEEQRKKDPQLN
ncbi:hypothetical protein EP01_02680 [Bdellovibrio bacteriovorus]|nr:hypothetical protein EP01_02680 [Bdellovibrio bacteriovorus]